MRADEACDRVDHGRALEDVVVTGAGDAKELLRFARQREQPLAERVGNDRVTIPVGGEERDRPTYGVVALDAVWNELGVTGQ